MPSVRKLSEQDKPLLRQLPQGRWQLVRYFATGNPDHFVIADAPEYDELDEATAAGQGLTDLRLRVREWDPRKDGSLVCAYETLTDTFVLAKDPVTDYDLNGLRRDTLTYVARVTADADAFIAANPDLDGNPLAKKTIVKEPGATVVELVYLQPGVISKAESPGPVQGTKTHTWVTWVLDATDTGDMGPGNTIPGVVTETKDDNFEGYQVRLWSSVGGTITGVKQTYKDVVDVDVPGTVELTTQAVTIGGESGTIAIAKVTPRRTKSIAASVELSIETTVPNTGSVAYDLGAISCSVTSTQAANNYRGYDVMSTISGGLTFSAPRRSINIGASVQVYPGCYLSSGSGPVTGTFTYTAGTQFERSSGGTIVTPTAMTSSEMNTLIGTGSTAADGYVTTAGSILRRKPRLVFTALNGTSYYEVLTWKVA